MRLQCFTEIVWVEMELSYYYVACQRKTKRTSSRCMNQENDDKSQFHVHCTMQIKKRTPFNGNELHSIYSVVCTKSGARCLLKWKFIETERDSANTRSFFVWNCFFFCSFANVLRGNWVNKGLTFNRLPRCPPNKIE